MICRSRLECSSRNQHSLAATAVTKIVENTTRAWLRSAALQTQLVLPDAGPAPPAHVNPSGPESRRRETS